MKRFSHLIGAIVLAVQFCASGTIVTEGNAYFPLVKKYVLDAEPAPDEGWEIREGDTAEDCIRKILLSWRAEWANGEFDGEALRRSHACLRKAYEMYPRNTLIKTLYGRIGYTSLGRYVPAMKNVDEAFPRRPEGTIVAFVSVMAPLVQESDNIPFIRYLFADMFRYMEGNIELRHSNPGLADGLELLAIDGTTDDRGRIELLRNYWLSKVSPSYFLPKFPERVREIEEAREFMAAGDNRERAIRAWTLIVQGCYLRNTLDMMYGRQREGDAPRPVKPAGNGGEVAAPRPVKPAGNGGEVAAPRPVRPAGNGGEGAGQDADKTAEKSFADFLASLEDPELKLGTYTEVMAAIDTARYPGLSAYLKKRRNDRLPNMDRIGEARKNPEDAEVLDLFFRLYLESPVEEDLKKALELTGEDRFLNDERVQAVRFAVACELQWSDEERLKILERLLELTEEGSVDRKLWEGMIKATRGQ